MHLMESLCDYMPESGRRPMDALNGHVAGVASALLVVFVAYKLAELTWVLIPAVPLSDPELVIAIPTQPPVRKATVDVSGDVGGLFGGLAAEPPQQGTPRALPETNLGLELAGIVAITTEEGAGGIAIIAANGGDQKQYVVGQRIDGTDAKLIAVQSGRIIVNRAGRIETLLLQED